MKILLDIKDSKASFVMKLLNNLNFVKLEFLTDEKVELMSSIYESVEEVKLVYRGKLKGIPAKILLDDL